MLWFDEKSTSSKAQCVRSIHFSPLFSDLWHENNNQERYTLGQNGKFCFDYSAKFVVISWILNFKGLGNVLKAKSSKSELLKKMKKWQIMYQKQLVPEYWGSHLWKEKLNL